MSKKFPSFQAHRGYWLGGLRENTPQAFEEAARLGAKMVEMDVQLSLERVPVVFHDKTLKRIFHVDEKVGQTKIEDLEALNVPKLSEILQNEKVPRYLNIELKSESFFCFSLAYKVIKELQKPHDKRVMISSFNPLCLFWVNLLAPSLPRALLLAKPKDILRPLFRLYKWISSPQYFNVHFSIIDDSRSRKVLIEQKRLVNVWTVNDEQKARFYLERGAAGVISDHIFLDSMK